jgi:formate-dependent nitrite reductase membrane component NrfD
MTSESRAKDRVKEIDDPSDVFSRITPAYDILKAAAPQGVAEPGYYGLPMLKRPFWKWEIALYFFFEGISAGSYVLCTIAGLRDRQRFGSTIRIGRVLSFLAMLPCPPLLIADLGRPERFHHMLRIFKRTSPMSHGAWALTGYGMCSSLLALLTINASRLPFGGPALRLLRRLLPQRLLGVLGMPFAFTMISYPGVLLSTTANPLWAQTHFLGSLFACSSMSNGAAALSLCSYGTRDASIHHALNRFEDVSAAAEAGALALYVGTARKAARPLFRGKQSRLFLVGAVAVGLIAPALLRRSKSPFVRSGLAPLLTLAGGLALKWSITYAGQESALDAELASRNAPTKSGDPFWGPKKARS